MLAPCIQAYRSCDHHMRLLALCSIQRFQVVDVKLQATMRTTRIMMRLALLANLVNFGISQYICDSFTYGRPDPIDCASAIQSVKGGKPPPDPSIVEPRLFVEPQYLDPPFDAVSPNPFKNDIVQLPKIWRHSEPNPCRPM